jgi:Domain of unknown function (DUF4157)/Novel toxin 16
LFALKVAKTQAKIASSPVPGLAPQRARLVEHRSGHGSAGHALARQCDTGSHHCDAAPARAVAPRGALGNFSKIPIFRPDQPDRSQALSAPPRIVLPRLAVRAGNDPLEHEANRVAGRVLRMPGPAQLSCKCDACEAQIPPVVDDVNRSGGKPMDAPLRDRFETAFGWSFANVRIHNDAHAAQAARAVNALAYTSGNHVVFADGQFAPGSASGRRLLAHELAHVVQQANGPVRPGISQPGDAAEREADRLANSVVGPSSFAAYATRSGASGARPAASAGGAANHAVQRQRLPYNNKMPPGDCTPVQYALLKAAVDATSMVVRTLGGCKEGDNCPLLATKIPAIAAEITARVDMVTTCFPPGGDKGHQEQIENKLKALRNCLEFFKTERCLEKLKAGAEAVAAAVSKALAVVAAAAAVVEWLIPYLPVLLLI